TPLGVRPSPTHATHSSNCHPTRSNGAFRRCGVEGSWHTLDPANPSLHSAPPVAHPFRGEAFPNPRDSFLELSSRPQQRRLPPLRSGGIVAHPCPCQPFSSFRAPCSSPL